MSISKYKFPSYSDVMDDIYIQYIENAQRTEEPHSHPFFQVFFLLNGKLTHHIHGVSADMSIGEMAIIPPNVIHHVTLASNPTYYSLSFTLSTFGEINGINEQSLVFLKSLEDVDTIVLPKTTIADEDILHVQSIFERIHKESILKETGFKESIRAYGILLITQFIRRYFITNPDIVQNASYTTEQMVLNCIKYIDTHFTEPLNISSISHMAAVSESTFCNCFKKLTGCTFQSYIHKLRIKYAISLIKKGHKITAVSTFCGYNDFSTFSRNFKKIVGISPREYCKKNL